MEKKMVNITVHNSNGQTDKDSIKILFPLVAAPTLLFYFKTCNK